LKEAPIDSAADDAEINSEKKESFKEEAEAEM
jgi:hypothetical protein